MDAPSFSRHYEDSGHGAGRFQNLRGWDSSVGEDGYEDGDYDDDEDDYEYDDSGDSEGEAFDELVKSLSKLDQVFSVGAGVFGGNEDVASVRSKESVRTRTTGELSDGVDVEDDASVRSTAMGDDDETGGLHRRFPTEAETRHLLSLVITLVYFQNAPGKSSMNLSMAIRDAVNVNFAELGFEKK